MHHESIEYLWSRRRGWGKLACMDSVILLNKYCFIYPVLTRPQKQREGLIFSNTVAAAGLFLAASSCSENDSDKQLHCKRPSPREEAVWGNSSAASWERYTVFDIPVPVAIIVIATYHKNGVSARSNIKAFYTGSSGFC